MDEIRTLTAIEHIRYRPDMYVRQDACGSVPDQLLQAAMCHPLAELSCGSASHLDVSIAGLAATVRDDGQGWPPRSATSMLTVLYACREQKEHAKLAGSLCRITLPVVVALSEVFTLDIRREGKHWQHVFRHGVASGPLVELGSSDESGTTLSFSLDPQFCAGAVFSAESFSAWLAKLPAEIPTSSITLHH